MKVILRILSFIVITTVIFLGCNKENFPPIINSFWASDSVVYSGSQVFLKVDAEDEDSLSYFYRATGGHFKEIIGDSAIWVSPAITSDQSYTISVDVVDQYGAMSSDGLNILVHIDTSVTNNHPPAIPTISIPVDSVRAGSTITIFAFSLDPDGDDLVFTWYSNGGTFDNAFKDTVRWTAPSVVGTTNVSISVVVADGRGGIAVNTDGIIVMGSHTGNNAPEILNMGTLDSTIYVGDTATLWVQASDPDGDSLHYNWSSTGGYFINNLLDTVKWIAPAVQNQSSEFTLSVGVYDPWGANTFGTMNITVLNTDFWFTVSNMPTARAGAAYVTLDGKIYVIGGVINHVTTNIVEVYDPSTDTWETKSSMPTARLLAGACVLNGKIYVVGGLSYEYNVFYSTNEVYDPVSDKWSTCAPMPTARKGLGVVAYNKKMYAIGGYDGNTFFDINEVYDPLSDSWVTMSPMPTPREKMGIVTYEGKIYVIGGGQDWFTMVSANEVYDPSTDSWQSMAPLPTARRAVYCGEINGKIYIIGGRTSTPSYTDINEIYDINKNIWRSGKSKPTPAGNLAGGVVNDIIYVIGGKNDSNGYLSTNEAYIP